LCVRIDREYAQPLDVEELARGVHLSAGHLSYQFRLADGESPCGHLMTGASSGPWPCCAGAT
jgi:AraC-like DNA-binding protein